MNEDSPLYGWTIDDLREKMAWFVVTVQGTEASTMQTVMFSHIYSAGGSIPGRGEKNGQDIICGREFAFADVATEDVHAGRVIDFDRIDELVRIDGDDCGGDDHAKRPHHRKVRDGSANDGDHDDR